MNPQAKAEDIIKAANFANVHNLILKLPQGYETNALSLSGGERQRVALARAFFGNPKVVILDEPNSNLDSEGEKALINTITNARNSQITTIIISHRPSILKMVDKIMALHMGQLAMYDDALEVIKKMGK